MEKTNEIKRSELWNKIYNIVSQIPRRKVEGDCVDPSSASTEIERLILRTTHNGPDTDRPSQDSHQPKCNGNCGMNYCDENGCVERKRILSEPIEKSSALKVEQSDIIKFLLGEGSLNGVWYGDPRPDNEKGNFWWRKYLREYATQEREKARREAVQECIEIYKMTEWYDTILEKFEKLKGSTEK